MATPRQTLTVQLAHAQMRIAELEIKLADAQERALRLAVKSLPAIKTVAHTPWVRPAHMEAARQAAMAGHCVVRV